MVYLILPDDSPSIFPFDVRFYILEKYMAVSDVFSQQATTGRERYVKLGGNRREELQPTTIYILVIMILCR